MHRQCGSIGTLGRVIRKLYAPFLLRPLVKGAVVLTFGGIFIASVISIQHIELGLGKSSLILIALPQRSVFALDQRLALPSDSYLVPYFDNVDAYFDMGRQFISSRMILMSHVGPAAESVWRFTTCSDLSVANILEAERSRTEVSFLSQPIASWIDDFLNWLNPSMDSCCRVKSATQVHSVLSAILHAMRTLFEGRLPAWNITMDGFPEGDEFMRYLNQWLASPTSEDCPLAGQASFVRPCL